VLLDSAGRAPAWIRGTAALSTHSILPERNSGRYGTPFGGVRRGRRHGVISSVGARGCSRVSTSTLYAASPMGADRRRKFGPYISRRSARGYGRGVSAPASAPRPRFSIKVLTGLVRRRLRPPFRLLSRGRWPRAARAPTGRGSTRRRARRGALPRHPFAGMRDACSTGSPRARCRRAAASYLPPYRAAASPAAHERVLLHARPEPENLSSRAKAGEDPLFSCSPSASPGGLASPGFADGVDDETGMLLAPRSTCRS